MTGTKTSEGQYVDQVTEIRRREHGERDGERKEERKKRVESEKLEVKVAKEEDGRERKSERKRDETIHLGTLGGDQAYTPSWLSHRSTPPLLPPSIHPSFAPPAGISLKNLNAKKSCQAYFLVIAHPSPPDSDTFPPLPEIKRTRVAPQGVRVREVQSRTCGKHVGVCVCVALDINHL